MGLELTFPQPQRAKRIGNARNASHRTTRSVGSGEKARPRGPFTRAVIRRALFFIRINSNTPARWTLPLLKPAKGYRST